MKLRNKKTGEIGWLYCDHISIPKKMTVFSEDKDLSANHWDYSSLAELNKEWEDYEEPKESKEPKKYWFINSGGGTASYYEEDEEPEDTEACKEIGNYFETEEEAEKAVERLRAWKRLKDKGFRFDKWCNVSAGSYKPIWFYFEKDTALEDVKSDLDLLFGGEE